MKELKQLTNTQKHQRLDHDIYNSWTKLTIFKQIKKNVETLQAFS